jgi:hypothetical protein
VETSKAGRKARGAQRLGTSFKSLMRQKINRMTTEKSAQPRIHAGDKEVQEKVNRLWAKSPMSRHETRKHKSVVRRRDSL